jgi:hypothetical protein
MNSMTLKQYLMESDASSSDTYTVMPIQTSNAQAQSAAEVSSKSEVKPKKVKKLINKKNEQP